MAMDCAILGDSIAVGVAQQRAYCYRDAVGGINSRAYLGHVANLTADHVLISLGSNDVASVDTQENLLALRQRIHATTVTWLLSSNKIHAHDAAKRMAEKFGDRVIEVRPYVGSDGVHPTGKGYRAIADQWLPVR